MANIKKSEKDVKPKQYFIIPRDQETYEEKYAVANRRKLPFETPVYLTEKDVAALEHQKEPFKSNDKMTPYEIMDKYQCTIDEARKIAEAQAQHPEIGGTSIKWRSKYILKPV